MLFLYFTSPVPFRDFPPEVVWWGFHARLLRGFTPEQTVVPTNGQNTTHSTWRSRWCLPYRWGHLALLYTPSRAPLSLASLLKAPDSLRLEKEGLESLQS